MKFDAGVHADKRADKREEIARALANVLLAQKRTQHLKARDLHGNVTEPMPTLHLTLEAHDGELARAVDRGDP